MKKVEVPKDSVLAQKSYDYADSFMSEVRGKNISSLAIGRAFFASSPMWVRRLMRFRNKIVSHLGLKTGAKTEEEALKNFKGEPGEEIGIFKVFERTENELILGEDDKHLDFRVSLFLRPIGEGKNELTMSTIVNYNNWLGKLYFLPVKPFHRLIVPNMLKRTIKELEATNNG